MPLDQTKSFLILIGCLSIAYGEEKGFTLMDETATQNIKVSPHVYYLSAIIYYNKDQWAFWINGEKKTSTQDTQLPFDVCVFPEYLLCKIKTEGKEIKLYPNQTIHIKNCQIHDGDCRSSITQLEEQERILKTDGQDFDY